MSKALVVLSGGQDSVTCLFEAVQRVGADNVHAVTFNYGQRHVREIDAALKTAALAGVHERHEVLNLPESVLLSTSPLTDKSAELEQYQNATQMAEVIGDRIEKTFVPMRNALFLTLAANRAVALGVREIWTGVCQEDNANYPDCREEFINEFVDMMNEALGTTRQNWINVVTPLMDYSKVETVQLAWSIPGCYGALAYSHTAYDGQFPPIGRDHATVLRASGFAEANLPDPLVLRAYCCGLMELPQSGNYDLEVRNNAIRRIQEDLEGKWDMLPDAPQWL